jgi:hypothetical protein
MTTPVTEADPDVIRAWLRGQGEEVSDRGRLSAAAKAKYAAAHPAELDGQATLDDYDGTVTAGDFGPDLPDDNGPGPDMTENVPRGQAKAKGKGRAKRQRPAAAARGAAAASSAAGGARGLWGKVKAAGKGKAKGPWMPTGTVIEHFWSQLAWAARPMPPLQKILAAQAPMAGILLEDATKGTFIDRVVLQPVARAEQRLQAVNAMVGPPLWTLAIATMGGAVTDAKGMPLRDPEGNFVFDDRTRMMVGGLRFSLMSWLKIADKQADEIMEQADELNRLGDEADKLIEWILAPPTPGMSAKDVEKEAQQRGADFISGNAQHTRPHGAPAAPPGFSGATQADITRTLDVLAGGSAFRPTPATGSQD